MAIFEQLLKTQLSKTTTDPVSDQHETARPYRRWAIGFRTLIRLRYVAIKKDVLAENRQALRYDVTADEVQQRVLDKVLVTPKAGTWWSVLLRPAVFYPLVLLLLAAAAYLAFHAQQSALERSVFKSDIPHYADTVYQLKALQAQEDDSADQSPDTAQLEATLEESKQKILDHFQQRPDIASALSPVLDGVRSNDLSQPELMQGIRLLNDQLFDHEVPYYISLMSEIADCAHLPIDTFLPRLFGGGENSDKTCLIHALLSFHVDEHRYYADGQIDHLAYFTRRLDDLTIFEQGVLGRVHIGDNTAQILLGNIEGASASSLNAVNEGVLQTKLMPQGMPDVYGLESLARRLQSRVIEQYVKEFESSWRWRLQRVVSQLTGKESSLLFAAAKKLQRRTADVTAFHEVQHLVDQTNNLQEPDWFQNTLDEVGDSVPSNEKFREHVLWELSAFFTHFAYGGELNGILLNEFTAITLDPMLQDQPHYYSIRILLPVLQAMQEGTLGNTPPTPASTLGDVARSYKLLATNADDLDRLARESYRLLFGQDIPDLREIELKSRRLL